MKKQNEWLRTLYVEAWKQYIHEDNLGQRRNNHNIAFQISLIGSWLGISGFLLNLSKNNQYNFMKIIFCIGIISFFFAIFAILLIQPWIKAIEAGRSYLNMRWVTAKSIEEYAKLKKINLAGLEDRWHQHSKDYPDEKFYPFRDWIEMRKHSLEPKSKIGGWISTVHESHIILGLWIVILIFSTITTLYAFYKIYIFSISKILSIIFLVFNKL